MKQLYDHQGYEIKVVYTALVIKDGKEVYKTRECRLLIQAEALADDWLRERLGITYPDAINLEVDDFALGASCIFSGGKNG